MPPQWGHFSYANQAKAPKINFQDAAPIQATPVTNEADENLAPDLSSTTPSKSHDGITPKRTHLSHRNPLADISNSPASTATLQSNVASLNEVETPRDAKHVRFAITPSALATSPADGRVTLSAASSATLLGSSPVIAAAMSAAASLPEFLDIAPTACHDFVDNTEGLSVEETAAMTSELDSVDWMGRPTLSEVEPRVHQTSVNPQATADATWNDENETESPNNQQQSSSKASTSNFTRMTRQQSRRALSERSSKEAVMFDQPSTTIEVAPTLAARNLVTSQRDIDQIPRVVQNVHYDLSDSTLSHPPSLSFKPLKHLLSSPTQARALALTDRNHGDMISNHVALSQTPSPPSVKHVRWAATPSPMFFTPVTPLTSSSAVRSSSSPISPAVSLAALSSCVSLTLSSADPPDVPPAASSVNSPDRSLAVPSSGRLAHSPGGPVASAALLSSSKASPAISRADYNILTSDVIVPPPIMRADGYVGNGKWAVDHVISHRRTKGRGNLYLLQYSGINPKTKQKYDPKEEPEVNLSKELIEGYRAQIKARKAAQRAARRKTKKSDMRRRTV